MGVAEKSVLPEELNSSLHYSQSSKEERGNCTQVGWCTGTQFVNYAVHCRHRLTKILKYC